MTGKQKMCCIGAVLGIVIIVIGFCVMNPDIGMRDRLGSLITFGGDFYTEMYAVTVSVGRHICTTIGWLIVALGVMDVCYFLLKTFDSAKPEAPLSNNSTYQQQNDSSTRPSNKETIPAAAENPENQIKNDAKKAPYRCGKCGQNGPYNGNCPSCGSSIKFYNN